MDGVHDMGGMHGFGKVPYEKDEPTFHHEWERRVWGLCQGSTYPDCANLDYGRHSIELMPPDLYLSYSYFERWLYSLTTTLLSGELVTLEEVQVLRHAQMPQAQRRSIPMRTMSIVAKLMQGRCSKLGTA